MDEINQREVNTKKRQLYPQAIESLRGIKAVYTKYMDKKQSAKPTKKDKAWQQKIEKQVTVEKVKLDNPQGREKFERVISNVLPGKKYQ